MDQPTDRETPVLIETALGRLAGTRKGGISRFKAIPFAKPPVGPLRWRFPKAPEPWSGVRDATKFGFVAPQAPSQLETLMGLAIGEQSEDCLYLNVWTPGCDDTKRPVMVWLHGGAFVIGAGSQRVYNGKHLASRDVVVVTINYRLGALGFLNLHDATGGRAPGTGSEGLADQIAALKWVRENIAVFGGDPQNITLFGESAGGMSVACLMGSAQARGLYHKAIPQSGAGHIGNARERAARIARATLDAMGIAPENAEQLIDAPYGAIIAAQIGVLANARDGEDTLQLGRMPYQPCVDGEILMERPIDAVRNGMAQGVPILTGTTREEWKLFTAAAPRIRMMTRGGLEKRIVRAFGEDEGRKILSVYGDGSAFDRWNAINTDRIFTVPAIRLLEAQSAYAPSFAYRFDWTSKLMGGIFGSCHALELGFMFGTHNEGLAGRFFGTGPEADMLAATMMDCWTDFAKTGTPAPTWPTYGMAQRQTMILGDGAAHIMNAPNEMRRQVWDTIAERKLGT
ncbi:MAG TPA: carboxylesterase/lipase family protein [Rhizomicrobium sp.]|nr:carboxylesterase/lipase family protein [Rhizomicrobium sp.]